MGLIDKLKKQKPTTPETQADKNEPEQLNLPEGDGIVGTSSDDDVLTVYLSGKIDSTNFEAVRDEILDLLTQYPTVIIDVKRVIYASSSGLRMFFTIQEHCTANNIHCKITNASQRLRFMFQQTGYSFILHLDEAPEDE